MTGSAGEERFDAAIAAIDAANADDPNTLLIDGTRRPKEQAHAEMMTEWVRRLADEPDEAQLLAARAHHLRRWDIPRSAYPEGRRGYLRWRTDQKKTHAALVGEILTSAGYSADTIERVQRIVRKEGLGKDEAVQIHEDALCLVFLQTQFSDLEGDVGEDKMVDILVKTLRKMSPDAIATAAGLDLSDQERAILDRAVAEAAP